MVGISPAFDNFYSYKQENPNVKLKAYSRRPVKPGHFIFAAFFLTAYIIFLFSWIGIFLNNMDFTDRYTHLSQAAASSFRHTARYEWQWGFIYAMFFINVFMGYFLAAAICNNSHPLWARVHLWFSSIAFVGNFVIFLTLAFIWLVACNTSSSVGSPCNNPQWCCDHRNDAPEWCQNTITCGGTVSRARSDEFFATFMYSWILILFSWAHRSVHKYLWSVGMFEEERVVTVTED